MNIYFDTEFTGLHKNTTLISLGMISEDGKKFYAEFNDFDKDVIDDWINENVIKKLWFLDKLKKDVEYFECIDVLTTCVGSTQFIKEKLINWLKQFDKIQLVSDVCYFDMVLFIDIFGTSFDLPKNINPACHDINQDIAKWQNISEYEAFNLDREKLAQSYNTDIKHNALYDAILIRDIYNLIYQSE